MNAKRSKADSSQATLLDSSSNSSLPKSRTNGKKPHQIKPKAGTANPSFLYDLEGEEKPTMAVSEIGIIDPDHDIPKVRKVDPMYAKLLSEILDSKCKKSSASIAESRCAMV